MEESWLHGGYLVSGALFGSSPNSKGLTGPPIHSFLLVHLELCWQVDGMAVFRLIF